MGTVGYLGFANVLEQSSIVPPINFERFLYVVVPIT